VGRGAVARCGSGWSCPERAGQRWGSLERGGNRLPDPAGALPRSVRRAVRREAASGAWPRYVLPPRGGCHGGLALGSPGWNACGSILVVVSDGLLSNDAFGAAFYDKL